MASSCYACGCPSDTRFPQRVVTPSQNRRLAQAGPLHSTSTHTFNAIFLVHMLRVSTTLANPFLNTPYHQPPYNLQRYIFDDDDDVDNLPRNQPPHIVI